MRLHHDDPRSYTQDFQRFERFEESYKTDTPPPPWLELEEAEIKYVEKPVDSEDKSDKV